MRASDNVDQDHLQQFVQGHKGVEGFVEPRTAVSDVTLLLVAHDGEWTRRRVPSVDWAHKFCNRHQVPSYDAAVVGIPQRMRLQPPQEARGQLNQDPNAERTQPLRTDTSGGTCGGAKRGSGSHLRRRPIPRVAPEASAHPQGRT